MTNTENVLYPAPTHRYKVLVVCNTYNHSKYIEETLNGFAIQQTNFPFTCLVMDDASTDGEQEVLKGWMRRECDMSKSEVIDIATSEVIIVPHRTNTSCNFAFYLLKQNLYGNPKKNDHVTPWRDACEYEAICEGDDYWIDPLKLQKQVDFLDNNPEYGMCYTQCQYFYQDKKCLAPKPRGGVYESFEQLIKVNTIPTLTVLMRSNLQKKYTEEIKPTTKGWLMGDYPMWLWFAYNSKIKFLSYCTSVYRVLSSSASHFISIHRAIEFAHSVVDIQTFYYDLYTSDKSDEKYKKYITSLRIYALHDYKKNFFEIWKSGIKANPLWLLRFNTYKYILFFFMPLKLKERYKK